MDDTSTAAAELRDRTAIADLTLRIVNAVDFLQWSDLEECFTDEIVVDYEHVLGNGPEEVTAEEFVEQWKHILSGFEATQHLLSNHRVDVEDDIAECTAYFQAHHYYPDACGDSHWTLGGHYHFDCVRTDDGWRIERLVMTALWASGNQYLLENGREDSSDNRSGLNLVETNEAADQ
jgi:hypothetical protein